MKRNILWLLILGICLIQTAIAQEPVAASSARGYLVGPGDEITAKVLGEEQFNFVATVDENGNIEVPYFDQPIQAMCKNERELKADVVKLLSKYVRTPQVSVNITERKSRPPVTISGEVKNQQQVTLTRKTHLFELISFSGGVTEDAGGLIQIFRTQPPMCGEKNEIEDWKNSTANGLDVPSQMYSLTSLRQGREEANPVIYPGDIVVVQRAAPVYITGEVVSPQALYLKEGGMTLQEAVAKLGGIRREAKTKDIKIYRLKANSKDREIISVNYDLIKKNQQKDVMLEPYDIVEVDKSKKSIGQTILEIATGTARTAITGLPGRVLY